MPSPRPNDNAVDATPLLTTTAVADRLFRIHRPRSPSLRGAARFLGRRRLRDPSLRVRDAAAQQIEERQSAWAYSRPIVVVDLLWNSALVMLSVMVIVMSRKEAPEVPLRMWIAGYVAQCCVHMVCVCVEFKRRRSLSFSDRMRNSSSESEEEEEDAEGFSVRNDDDTSVAKHLESANTMFSFIWWIIGFYWISAGGETLAHDSPQLYWLCITFMAFDVFFVVICVAVACVIGIAVCCCLPCIIAILYAVADQEGATKDDIERLPKYKFRRMKTLEKQNGEIQETYSGTMTECNTNMPNEHILSMEDAECCICLCSYEDDTELRELPCRHHFHCACIDKWLFINATCPLCKFNILKNDNLSSSEEV